MYYRIRRVKCDEEKPACHKCYSTNRVCDGYSTNFRDISNAVTTTQLLPKLPTCVAPASSMSLPGTDQERRSFDFFCRATGPRIFSIFRLGSSQPLVLQICHYDVAVRSAVVALGSMGECLQCSESPHRGDEIARAYQQFAQYQYCKALKHLRTQIAKEANSMTNSALIASLLFLCFESMVRVPRGSLSNNITYSYMIFQQVQHRHH